MGLVWGFRSQELFIGVSWPDGMICSLRVAEHFAGLLRDGGDNRINRVLTASRRRPKICDRTPGPAGDQLHKAVGRLFRPLWLHDHLLPPNKIETA